MGKDDSQRLIVSESEPTKTARFAPKLSISGKDLPLLRTRQSRFVLSGELAGRSGCTDVDRYPSGHLRMGFSRGTSNQQPELRLSQERPCGCAHIVEDRPKSSDFFLTGSSPTEVPTLGAFAELEVRFLDDKSNLLTCDGGTSPSHLSCSLTMNTLPNWSLEFGFHEQRCERTGARTNGLRRGQTSQAN